MNIVEFITGYKGKDIPKELKEFNWGAFLLTFIWGIKHKAWITLLAIPLIWFQMPYGINWLLLTVLQIYCGIKGNEWAYQVNWWQKPSDFRKTQMKWAISAVLIHISIPVIITVFIMRFFKKSEKNALEYLRNTHCVETNNKLTKNLKKTFITSNARADEIAESFAKNYNNAKVEANVITFTSKRKQIDESNMTFIKINENVCSIQDKNCIIYSSYIMPYDLYIFEDCTFFFDNQKNIKPDKSTQDAINKGTNIFKYL